MPVKNPQPEPVPSGESRREKLEALLKLETPQNGARPNLSPKDLMLAIALLAEWMEENPDVEAEKIYEKYNARRKGFSRPEIRFLLTQLANLTDP